MAQPVLYLAPHPHSFQNAKVLVTLKYGRSELGQVDVRGPAAGDAHSHLATSRLPALEADSNRCLQGAAAVSHYLAPGRMKGSSAKDSALVQQWINLADSEIVQPACAWVFPELGLMKHNKK
eukprot:g28778.t1